MEVGRELVLELPLVDGTVSRRHYTIRHHDAASATLAIDFVLHGEGASAEWLAKAGPGTEIEAAGPRGHTYLREADWHLFVGDETATPAILAMIENLPAGACATAVLECGSEADRLLPERTAPEGAKIVFIWCERGAAAPASNMLLCDALERLPLAAGRGHAYVLGETGKVRAIRHRLIARGLSKDRITCEGYWRPGRIGGHDHI